MQNKENQVDSSERLEELLIKTYHKTNNFIIVIVSN